MTYNTDLQSNNVELQEILDAVNDLPEAGGGGSSGGGTVDTCTINVIDNLGYNTVCVVATILNENGEVEIHNPLGNSEGSKTINNVLCNSALYVKEATTMGKINSEGMTLVESYQTISVFATPSTAGSVATITINSGSGGYA